MSTPIDLAPHTGRLDDAPTMYQAGLARLHRREYVAAIELLSRAVALADDSPYRVGLGAALSQAGRFADAATQLEIVLGRDPHHREAARHLAWIALNQRQPAGKGIALLASVIARDPDSLDDYIGVCLHWLLGEQPSRVAAAEIARVLPGARLDYIHRGLAIALMNTGRYDEALALLQAMPPELLSPDAIADRARATLAIDGAGAARACCEWGLSQYPDNAGLIALYLQALFRLDDFPAARAIYRDPVSHRVLHGGRAGAHLDPNSQRGRTVLLRAVGGYGDTIQWVRFAPWLVDRGCRVAIECLPALAPLLRSIPGIEVVTPYDRLPPCDVECRADVPALILDWTCDDLCRQMPYVPCPADARGHDRSIAAFPGLRVGVCWRSGYNRDTELDPYTRRSIDVERLAPLLSLPGVKCFSLCQPADDAPASVVRVSDRFANFVDTAAALAAVDLVVTVDTSVAHLAGAMNRPTWLMLPRIACWRWGEDAERTAWYPSLRLARQSRPGEWDPVVARVVEDVRARAQAMTSSVSASRSHAW